MYVLPEMLNEAEILPYQQIGLVRVQALQLHTFLPVDFARGKHSPWGLFATPRKRKYGVF